MLEGLLMFLMLAASYGLVYLAYGKKGMEIRESIGAKNIGLCFLMPVLIILGVVPYVLFIIYARNWTKRAAAELKEEEERLAQERREKEEERKKREEEELKKIEEAEAKVARFSEIAANNSVEEKLAIQVFLENVIACQKYADILLLWEAQNPAPNEINTEIRKEIERKLEVERMYGVNPRGIPAFVERLRQTYGAAEIEVIPVVEEPEPEQEPVVLMENMEDFLEKAASCERYSEIMSLWESFNPEETEINAKITEKIKAKVSVERMYGVNTRGMPAFLESLRQIR